MLRLAQAMRIVLLLVAVLLAVLWFRDRGHQKIDARGIARLNQTYEAEQAVAATAASAFARCGPSRPGCRANAAVPLVGRYERVFRAGAASFRAAAADARGGCRAAVLLQAGHFDAAAKAFGGDARFDASSIGLAAQRSVARACGLKLKQQRPLSRPRA